MGACENTVEEFISAAAARIEAKRSPEGRGPEQGAKPADASQSDERLRKLIPFALRRDGPKILLYFRRAKEAASLRCSANPE